MEKYSKILGIVFLRLISVSANLQQIHFKEETGHQDTLLIAGNVGELETDTVLRCANRCKITYSCMSIFYQSTTKQCVLNPFLGTYLVLQSALTTNSIGWKYYEKVDGFGLSSQGEECLKAGFLYDHPTGTCYIIKHDVIRAVDVIYQVCANMSSNIIKLPSRERQDWISAILVTETSNGACIQGNNANDENEFKFDDGTPMTFFNWGTNQPNGGTEHYIVMNKDKNYEWYDWGNDNPIKTCLVVCEK